MITRDTRLTRQDASAPTAPVQGGDVFAGKYVIDRVIGAGAMGVVVAANHAQLGEKVVLKFLRAEMAQRPEVVSRFLREARSAVRMRSEHIARILDVGTTATGLPYIVMEHLDGCDLQQWLRTRGALPIADAVEYVAQTCLGMAEAHAAGVIHRDLKPSNLFLTHRGDGSRLVKVLDFGISKVIADASDQTDLTSTNGMLGSPTYVSPEQARCARSVDARADVWSLGVILHYLLTGKPPFVGDSITEVLAAILFGTPTRLTEACPDAPPELEAILLRCLEKEVERRMPSVVDLAVALAPWAEPDSRATISRMARPSLPESNAMVPVTASTRPVDHSETTTTAWTPGVPRRGNAIAKGIGLGIAVVVGGAIGTAFLARGAIGAAFLAHERAPARAVLSPAVVNAAQMGAAEPGPSDEAAGRPSGPGGSGPWAGLDGAEAASARAPDRPAPTSKAAKSNGPRPPAPAIPNKTLAGTGTPPIDPGSLTFDLGSTPSARPPSP